MDVSSVLQTHSSHVWPPAGVYHQGECRGGWGSPPDPEANIPTVVRPYKYN